MCRFYCIKLPSYVFIKILDGHFEFDLSWALVDRSYCPPHLKINLVVSSNYSISFVLSSKIAQFHLMLGLSRCTKIYILCKFWATKSKQSTMKIHLIRALMDVSHRKENYNPFPSTSFFSGITWILVSSR